MGSEWISNRMPERVLQVEFSEVQRIPTGLTRAVKAGEVCCLFLEKGCVVVRELVEEEGRKVVKSIGVPVNSGMVRTIYFEDEVVEETKVCNSCGVEFSTHPSNPSARKLECVSCHMKRLGLGNVADEQAEGGNVGDGNLALQKVAERMEQQPTPVMGNEPSTADASQLSPPSQEQAYGGRVPANAEEAILNRRPRRR